MPPLRLVFFGTPEIAVPTLERLIAGPHEVVGIVSQPDRARGRGRKLSPSPVSAVALREEIPLVRPEKIGETDAVEALRAMRPDLGIVVAFGQFIPRKVRELPSRGYLINAHASLLPKYRGASPIAQAILEGEAETGVSVMRIEREMDGGPVALVHRTPIEAGENTAELTERLARIAASAIEECVSQIEGGSVAWSDQDAQHATVAPKLEKRDAILDLRRGASELVRRIHALSPKPGGTLSLIHSLGEGADTTDLKITRARALPFDELASRGDRESLPQPGAIERNAGSGADPDDGDQREDSNPVALRIATGDGWLVPLVVQRAGGKALPVEDFLRGFEISSDARVGLPDPNPDSEAPS